jgi:alkanesulfonate monooxygenase SsuD/methylene tetrahydromethanopterin reductase-like flavin-dependent oxidoreductase (luciferase family)
VPLRVGFQVWGQHATWAGLMAEARSIEALGFASLWANDHFWPAAGAAAPSRDGVPGGFLEGWITLAGFASVTRRIPLGILVSCAGYRNVGLLVKQATALDHMSEGRMTLGLGAGWHEREHRAFGFDFPAIGDRISRMVEQAAVIRPLLDGETVTRHGTWVNLDGARNEPGPVGPLPLLIAGNGEKRTIPAVARYADAWNGEGDPASYRRRNALLSAHCEALGRDPASVVRTVGLPPLCIRDTRAEAVAVLAGILEHNALSPEEARATAEASPLVGEEASVVEALDAWAEAGAAEAMIDRPSPFDDESLGRLASSLALPATP